MHQAGAVLVETVTDIAPAELQRIHVPRLQRLTVTGETTGGGQATGAGAGA